MTGAQILVITKAPVPGRSKTRLTPPCSPEQAASIAAASVADTLDAVRAVPDVRRVVALDGPRGGLDLDGLVVVPQVDGDLGTRLAAAFAAAMDPRPLPTLLIGMDTPQVSAELLADCLARLRDAGPDGAVLGPAPDGGWWALGLHSATPRRRPARRADVPRRHLRPHARGAGRGRPDGRRPAGADRRRPLRRGSRGRGAVPARQPDAPHGGHRRGDLGAGRVTRRGDTPLHHTPLAADDLGVPVGGRGGMQ